MNTEKQPVMFLYTENTNACALTKMIPKVTGYFSCISIQEVSDGEAKQWKDKHPWTWSKVYWPDTALLKEWLHNFIWIYLTLFTVSTVDEANLKSSFEPQVPNSLHQCGHQYKRPINSTVGSDIINVGLT